MNATLTPPSRKVFSNPPLKRFGGKTYLAPPYLPPTRTARKVYRHEMTYEQHVELLDFLPSLEARVMLSAYCHPEYQTRLLPRSWRCEEILVRDSVSSARSEKQKFEVLWMNYDAAGDRI